MGENDLMLVTGTEALAAHYRRSNAIAAMDPPLALEEVRDLDEHWGDVTAEPRGVDYFETDVAGVPAMWAAPKGCDSERVLLCLHGGGFIGGSRYTHRKLFGHLAKATGVPGVRALILEHRRLPEHGHPALVEDATAAYAWLLEQGLEPRRVALAGDSAGGGLTITANRDTDVLFGGATPMNLEALVTMFLGPSGNRRDPLASPLHADVSGSRPSTCGPVAPRCCSTTPPASPSTPAPPEWKSALTSFPTSSTPSR